MVSCGEDLRGLIAGNKGSQLDVASAQGVQAFKPCQKALPGGRLGSILQHNSELDNRLRTALGASSAASANPAENINNALYGPFRCALMHSGSSSDFTPFDPNLESRVQRVLTIMRGVAIQYVKYERRKLAEAV